MGTENPWGEFNVEQLPTLPETIMKDLALKLGEATSNVLEGRVKSGNNGNQFEISLYIVAPLLDSYTYTAIKLTHPITLYPASVWDSERGQWRTCKDVNSLKDALSEIVGSERIRRVVTSLLSQSRAKADAKG